VTYVTRLPIPSSPSGTSLSYVNQSSTTTDRRSSSIAASAWSPASQPVNRKPDEAAEAGKVQPDASQPPPVSGEETESPKPQQRRPSGIRSTLSCSQLLGSNGRHHPPSLVSVNSNPALMPQSCAGDDRQRDGLAPVSSA